MDDILFTKIKTQLEKVKKYSREFGLLSINERNKILSTICNRLMLKKDEILGSNKLDVENAIGYPKSFVDRLTINEKRINDMINGVKEIFELPDPLGEVEYEYKKPDGLVIKKIRVPIGVICVIYESRPNVTIDAAGLCLKSGNCVVLRGGKEAMNTNRTLVEIIKSALTEIGLSEECVLFIDSPDRELLYSLLKLDNLLDLVIARGSEEMIRNIRKEAIVPVLAHGKGLCVIYIDEYADLGKAVSIAYNAKVQRPGVCNAMETLLVHEKVASVVLPRLYELYNSAKVEMRGCENTIKLIPIKQATETDWETEYLDLILSIKIVKSLDEAIEHINKYGSAHSDAIVTENKANAEKFMSLVDSSAVFHNASTRLHDGGVFGLGAEIGISTQKLHARGTMGLRELTTTKYLVYGNGHIRT